MLTQQEKETLIFHVLFSLVCAAVLFAPVAVKTGIRLFILVLVYNMGIVIFGIVRNHRDWLNIWLFAIVLSVFQVFPDWYLSAQLGVLVFPEDGFFRIGSVSGYMAGLWAIPIFIIIYVGESVRKRTSLRGGLYAVSLASFVIFVGSEETMWALPSWYARDVILLGHVALYIVIPEIILGLSSYQAYHATRDSSLWFKVPAAFIVMLLYLGSASFFYFIIERVNS